MKRYFECVDSYGNIQQYEVNLVDRKSYFSMHLMLRILNKTLLKKVNGILEKALRDEDYKFPANWDESFIERNIKGRINDFFLTGLTDWRELKNDNESIEDFNARFSIWLCNFHSINEKNDWQKQLLESVKLSICWFLTVAKDDEWIINNTEYPALYLLKEKGRNSELQQKYLDVLSESKLKNETELYFKHLNQSC